MYALPQFFMDMLFKQLSFNTRIEHPTEAVGETQNVKSKNQAACDTQESIIVTG